MKHLLYLIFPALLTGCSNASKTDSTTKNDSLITVTLTNDQTVKAAHDTLHVGSFIFTIAPSSKVEFDKLTTYEIDTNEVNNLKRANGLVNKQGDSLIFQLQTGEKTLIKSNTGINAEADYEGYNFADNLKTINQWLLHVYYYESDDYVLVDQKTGKHIHVSGLPIISPDKRHIICVNEDLEAGFTFNGIDLLSYQNNELKLIGQRELQNYGLREARWLDNKSIIAQKIEQNQTVSYIKLNIN